jgi:hypothetical protein
MPAELVTAEGERWQDPDLEEIGRIAAASAASAALTYGDQPPGAPQR